VTVNKFGLLPAGASTGGEFRLGALVLLWPAGQLLAGSVLIDEPGDEKRDGEGHEEVQDEDYDHGPERKAQGDKSKTDGKTRIQPGAGASRHPVLLRFGQLA
jgi:hypothetical protein